MIPLRLGEVAAVVDARLAGADAEAKITGTVEFDSRRIRPGGLFVAFPGTRFDGHEFTADAVLRYRGTPLAARVHVSMDGSTAELRLAQPTLVAPGQAAVLYRGDEVIGGGVIDRPLGA